MASNCSPSIMPHWHNPTPENVTHDVGLMVMNSMTRKKERFVTIDGSRSVKWYMCGPTVYAPSHMGHARTYLGFDIIRRILSSHFGYDVTLVMNVTDIDDKIIQRANEQNIECDTLSKQFEAEFHEDMANLGVRPPDVLTRVTEYIDDIVTYIKTIVDKKMAYESNGSVYFDVNEFSNADGMSYCKLEPEQINNAELLAEGEGKLTQDFATDKHSPRDFALWKKSKPGEPSWDSPWGPGRPGWHIECSVMASDIFSQLSGLPSAEDCGNACRMDIHSGGVDLKFPHHDNEMAQAEAHSGCNQWVNYFVHAGHLHIKGFKMSKSLKNFITIRDALENNTARQIRLCFLLHKYNAPMDYGDNTMSHSLVTEKLFVEFFHNVKAVLREGNIINIQRWDESARQLQNTLSDIKSRVDAALRDDFDTPASINALSDLVKATNLYLDSCVARQITPVNLLLRNAAVYITHIFRIFGLIPDSAGGEIGFPIGGAGDAADLEEALTPVLDSLMQFRASVRDFARVKDTGGVLSECDKFRDDVLPVLGIRLEDKTGGKSVWKLADPNELMKEREQRELEKQRKLEEKRKAVEEKAKKDALNKLSPEEFMKQLTLDDNGLSKYSKFDDTTGVPTHLHDGEQLTKGQQKKAKKEFEGQRKKYEKYLKSLE
uniref:cysteine--tRNA ligase n=1 Tax=Eucampia antarctica TaxID=49252 RepID=A0A6U0T1A9_9STRA|mmetsp:Transcript_3624/g.3422  ORF Transcript_3624/g.3422 Transcript_3624/m.3422 type:complete len:659 (+) Transcript_3624:47-2023(+)|eukprot:CAMPEP_0197825572 /NCGR_PEP_ID=MMETSP1437-20131217/2612_1 /TAXON_ID=49252 ORGANISM="Eucampia antarctica, Strain CCMP1452" /NCGR_SAMPLE_ID=MMETSP1437 /ASSEMBLY_ACC=CAM_ASM_001096 /LENGTH=658 /DNA_ID=CAMNT_0043425605 /DNA_START=42 /DNA_END=2018 /DNA_ORIENTATION=-